MKKRLLITSIVMMLVVAVALSTATYAWFTSNAKVEANSMTLKAGVSDASALGIGWTGSGAGTSLTSQVYGILQPMAPVDLSVGTTAAETLVFKTSTTKQEGGVYKFNTDGSTPADPQLVYNNGSSVNSFYVRNLSNANTISSVTVKAVFAGDSAYTQTSDTNYQTDVDYYTRSEAGVYTLLDSYNDGDVISGTVYEYTPYILTKDQAIVTGTTYYTKDGSKFTKVASPDVNDIETYYEKISADDMIRIALFTKEYRQASGEYSTGTYYTYDTTTDVIKAATDLEAGDSLIGYYSVSSTNHLLKGVLGHNDTTGTSVGSDAFDLNKVYFTESEGIYSQDTTVTASNFASKSSGLYTCDPTAVYGAITADKAVNAMDYYANVRNQITIATNLKPGEQIDIVAYVWMDGTKLDDTRASELGSVSLEFAAA